MAMKTTLMLMLLLSSFFASQAQNLKAYEINEYLALGSNKQAAVQVKSSKISSSTPLKVLAYDLVPTVFIENGEIKRFDEQSPVKAEIEFNSFKMLSNANPIFKNVALLVVKLNEENQLISSLDFSTINSFNSLKYVYFICPFNCSRSQIENLSKGLPSGTVLLYSSSIPE